MSKVYFNPENNLPKVTFLSKEAEDVYEDPTLDDVFVQISMTYHPEMSFAAEPFIFGKTLINSNDSFLGFINKNLETLEEVFLNKIYELRVRIKENIAPDQFSKEFQKELDSFDKINLDQKVLRTLHEASSYPSDRNLANLIETHAEVQGQYLEMYEN